MLDYGCGTGGFLEMAQGSFGRVIGFDLNQNICKAHLKNNWECYNSIEEIKTEQIDIIVMFHVLEHSKKPWDLIKQISQHFVYTNYFVIEVPNTDEALNSLFHSEDYRKNHYSSQHLWYYTPDTIKSVVQRAGLTIRYETQIQRYLLSNIFGWLNKNSIYKEVSLNIFDEVELNKVFEEVLVKSQVADSNFLICGR